MGVTSILSEVAPPRWKPIYNLRRRILAWQAEAQAWVNRVLRHVHAVPCHRLARRAYFS
jgi:hypothetical protein